MNLVKDAGIDVNQVSSDGNTALIFAARYNKLDLVKELIEHGANATIKNKAGQTAVSIAKDYGFNQIYDYLIYADLKD